MRGHQQENKTGGEAILQILFLNSIMNFRHIFQNYCIHNHQNGYKFPLREVFILLAAVPNPTWICSGISIKVLLNRHRCKDHWFKVLSKLLNPKNIIECNYLYKFIRDALEIRNTS